MKIRRKQREMRTHAAKWLALVLLVLVCFIGYEGVQGVVHLGATWTNDLPSLENTDAFNFAEKSHMYAADNQTMLAEFQLENRDPITQDKISPLVLKGTVDTEDVRFYEHNGVDITGMARALLNNLRGGSLEGASTITQQLVRNTVLSQEATSISFQRKMREALLAIELEKRYSKDEILVLYLDTINYGDHCYGIEAAAQNYFQTSALDLTLTQAATLIGIPQSPTNLNPKTNPEDCLKRRNVVLDRMLSAGDITQDECNAAKSQDLGLNPAPPAPSEGIYAFPYFTSYVRQLLLENNNRYGVSKGDLFEGGLSIYTTLDADMQRKAEQACADQNGSMDSNLESALVAIDPKTGYLKAMVGGKDYNANHWNIATQGGQPTGSSFKAFTLAAAIEQGINPNTLIDCTSPMNISDNKTLENFNGINYGIRSIQRATSVSSNTGFYRLAEQVTPKAMNEMAERLGVNLQSETDLPIATLGTENVTVLDMASAYATFATGGVKHTPIVITKIVDKNNKTIYDASNDTDLQPQRVISDEVAGAVTKVLRTVFESSEGTAYGSGLSSGQPVAGKTGTVQEYRGHWLVGYTPSLSCATWIGRRDYEPTNPNLTANGLWKNFMSKALFGTEIEKFPDTKDPEYKNAFNTDQDKKYGEKSGTTSDGKGSDAQKNAPNVVGKTLADAKAILNGYTVYYREEYSTTVTVGVVIRQAIEDGHLMLYVSKGPEPAASD